MKGREVSRPPTGRRCVDARQHWTYLPQQRQRSNPTFYPPPPVTHPTRLEHPQKSALYKGASLLPHSTTTFNPPPLPGLITSRGLRTRDRTARMPLQTSTSSGTHCSRAVHLPRRLLRCSETSDHLTFVHSFYFILFGGGGVVRERKGVKSTERRGTKPTAAEEKNNKKGQTTGVCEV